MVVKMTTLKGNDNHVRDATTYQNIVGALQCLIMTRPDLSYLVNTVCQYMRKPTAGHYQLVKRVLHYVSGTIDIGLHILSESTLDLYACNNADWPGCPFAR